VAHGGLPLLAIGRLEGFEADGKLTRSDGEQVQLYVWVHVLGDERPARYAVAVADSEGAGAPSLRASDDCRVIGTVNADWRIDRISTEVEQLLGYQATELEGAPMLSAVHPNDVADLLSALGHTQRSGRGVFVRVRLRTAWQEWQLCRARLVALPDPPAFGFVLRSAGATSSHDDLHLGLKRQLELLAHEVRVAAMAMSSPAAPTVGELPALADLTSREWEVVVRLMNGARVPTISRELGLSPSTVRNHLSSIFHKLDVRSQAELLETLRRTSTPAPRTEKGSERV
jgi:DNA-binding CsgD family transcriptional regulator/PAS domain-containing protein